MSRRRLPSHLELTIDTLDADGHGIAAYGARQVRVKGGLLGETVTARVVGRRKGAVLTVAEEIVSPNAARVKPPCRFYPRCGGCSAQHVNHEAQLAHKQEQLLKALELNGVVYGELRAPVTGPKVGYRRKARLGVRLLHDQMLVGFRESFGGRIVKMDHCTALAAPFASLIQPLSNMLAALSIPDAIPQLETAVGDTGAALIIRHLQPFTAGDARILGEFERQYGIWIFTQSGGYDTVQPLNGPRDSHYLHYGLFEHGLDFEFSVTDFIQVNAHINAALVRSVLAALDVRSGETVADLFCGIGNFSLPLARRGARVVGYEFAQESVERAAHNARRNGLSERTEFHQADLHTAGADIEMPQISAALLDPPRSGAGPNLRHWLVPSLARVAYVSCNPVTFATDAKVLVEQGYELQQVGIYDMFPHTAHVETLGLFVSTSPPDAPGSANG